MIDSSRIFLPKRRLTFVPGLNVEVGGLEDIRLFASYSEKDDEWDEFLHDLEGAHHEQTSMWGRVKNACGGYQHVRFLAFRDGRLLGGCQVLHKKIQGIFHVGYICYGPQWSPIEEKLAFWLNEQLVAFIKALGIQYVYVDFPYDGFQTAEHFQTLGFSRHPYFLPPSGRMTASAVLNLTLSEDELLSRMRPGTRRNIRVGLRSGISIHRHVENSPELFTDLMWKLCLRRGCAPMPSERDFFAKIQESFAQSRQAHFFFAYLGDEPVSSHVVFTIGNWVRSWKVGWSGAHPKKYPNEVLQWEVIKWAKQAGYLRYDFVWIERESAEALIAGRDLPDTPYRNVALFKLGFGGKPILLPLPVSIVFNPALRAALYSKRFHKLMSYNVNIRKWLNRAIDKSGFFNNEYRKATVTIKNYNFKMEVADSRLKMAKGLSGRKQIKPDEGMLFVFGSSSIRTFWMKDMLIPIDILWIDKGMVLGIEGNSLPEPGVPSSQLRKYRSPEPVQYVLEIAGGRVDELGIRVGDNVKIRFE